jgi:hypothetical protein
MSSYIVIYFIFIGDFVPIKRKKKNPRNVNWTRYDDTRISNIGHEAN